MACSARPAARSTWCSAPPGCCRSGRRAGGAAGGDEGEEQRGRHGPEGWSAACGAARRRTSIVHAGRCARVHGRPAGATRGSRLRHRSSSQPGIAGRQPSGAGPSMGRPNACHRRTTWKPRPSYRASAPVGFEASTPSHASVMPRSRSAANEAAHSALATPRPRQARRTDTWSSQPREMPRRRVLLGEDVVLHRAHDLVAVPGDAPQRGVRLGAVEPRDEVRLLHLPVAPVVAERLVVGGPDRPVLVLGDRPQLDAGGQRVLRQGARQVPPHLEPEPDRHVAVGVEDRPVGHLLVHGVAPPLARAGAGIRGGRRREPLVRRAVQGAADALPAVLGDDGAEALGHERAVAHGEVARRLGDDPAVELRHEHVPLELEQLRVRVLGGPRLGRVDLVDAVGTARAVDDVGQRRPVAVRRPADPEPRDGGGAGDGTLRPAPDVGRHRPLPLSRAACGSSSRWTPAGSHTTRTAASPDCGCPCPRRDRPTWRPRRAAGAGCG